MIASTRGRVSRAAAVLAAVAALAALGAGPASSDTVAGCSGQTLTQPFLPWLDPAQYVLAPDGGLESNGADWTLSNGAKVISGNEPWHVRAAGDSGSLSLPSGSSATTGWSCVSLLHPTLRLFARNGGSLLATLKVEVLFQDAQGRVMTAPINALVGTSAWQPTLPMLILANATNLPVLTDGTLPVAFRFTPIGSGSGWQIDDSYVDPYQGR
jgi:hypothetical protein